MRSFWDVLFGRTEPAQLPAPELEPAPAPLPLPGQQWIVPGIGEVQIHSVSPDIDWVSYWFQKPPAFHGDTHRDLVNTSLKEFLAQSMMRDPEMALLIQHKERALWFANCARIADAGMHEDAEELAMVGLLAWDRLSPTHRGRMYALLEEIDR